MYKNDKYYYDIRCTVCGRFCKSTCDSGTPYGNSLDTEPPEDEYWCDSCAKKEEDHYVKEGRVPDYWIQPKWVRKAAKSLGFVEVHTEGDTWTSWYNPKLPLPFGYSIVKD